MDRWVDGWMDGWANGHLLPGRDARPEVKTSELNTAGGCGTEAAASLPSGPRKSKEKGRVEHFSVYFGRSGCLLLYYLLSCFPCLSSFQRRSVL